ncbi:MAG: hypothetical protein ACRBI6_12845 [Acidimicrobiales bacterium]
MEAWDGLADGSITVTFRRWKRPQVISGRQYRSPAGMLEIEAIEEIAETDITDADARSAGAADAAEVLERLGPAAGDTTLYRVRFHNVGADPRDVLRESIPDAEELAGIIARFDRLDAASSWGPWTRATLRVIAERPEVRAPDLAESFGRETKPFKLDVRKLKGMGLTESLRVGYRISPRGQAVLDALDAEP